MSEIDKRIDEIEARLKAATPGPWRIKPSAFERHCIGSDTRSTAKALFNMGSEDAEVEANAELIAHAPEDERYLLDALRAAEEKVDELEDALIDMVTPGKLDRHGFKYLADRPFEMAKAARRKLEKEGE